MNEKLDHLFRFRDNENFKKVVKVFTIAVLAYAFAILCLVTWASLAHKDISQAWAFSVIPLLLIVSFLKKNDYLFILAEIVTVIADIFLMLLRSKTIGFPIYIFVQIVYAVYFFIRDPNRKRQIITTIVRVVAVALGVLLLKVVGKSLFEAKTVFGLIYFINILINILCTCFVKDPILIVGFSLFALSDLFILFGIVIPNGGAFKKFTKSFNFVHFFYLISQSILIFNKYNNDYSRKVVK